MASGVGQQRGGFVGAPLAAETSGGAWAGSASASWWVGVMLASTLAGCGGGGGSPAPAPVPAPAPAPVPAPAPSPVATGPIAAQLTVPTPVGYDAERLAAFNRLNELRLAAGLGMLAQQTQMDQAAQAHAAWMVANDSFTHEEVAGTVGFTGTDWPQRDESSGYLPVGGSEVIAGSTGGAAGVNILVNGVFHRAALLAFAPVDVGIGWSVHTSAHVSTPLVIDLTSPGTDSVRGMGQQSQAPIHGVVIWPLDGAKDVPVGLGDESPNPVPDVDVLTLGTPVSINMQASKTILVNSFAMTIAATGESVQVRLLSNTTNSLIPHSFVALVPTAKLKANTTYSVSFTGSAADSANGTVESVSRNWMFATGTD